MPTVKYLNHDKGDFNSTLFAELKILGVKVPKHKRIKSTNVKVEKCDNKVFGLSLKEQEWILEGESHLPKFLALSTAYLQKFANKEIGIFRKAGNVARQKKLRAKVEEGGTLEDSDPNDVASLLKQWLRELPEPLVSSCLQEIFLRSLQVDTEENRVPACLLTCLLLQPDHLHTLKHLLCFLADVAFKSDENKMDAHNLAVIMAPNIFVSCESSDKMKNNLFQQQTSVMKILIENCDKVGEFPDGITHQQLCPSSELDSSSEVLDSVPTKSRKKHKNDIFSGIRKLVGQNGTPNSKNETPEHLVKTPLDFKSASKRKADLEMNSLSTIKNKKPALSIENLSNPSLSATPKKKTNGPDKNTCGHVRRKSIGALLRRKRGKSSKVSEIKSQAKDESHMCSLAEIGDKNKEVQNMNIYTNNFDFKSEQVTFKSTPIIKKSVSDCRLPVVDIEFSAQPALFISSSQGCLPKRPTKTSSQNLRSEKYSGSQIGEATVLDLVHEENYEKNMVQKQSHKKGLSVKQPDCSKYDCKHIHGNTVFSNIENKQEETLLILSKNHDLSKLKDEKNHEFIVDFLNSKRKSPLLSLPSLTSTIYNDASSPAEFITKTENNSVTINGNTPEVTDSQSYGLKRQEAFIVKSIKASPSITGSQIKSFSYDTPELKSQMGKNQSVKINSKLSGLQHDNERITPQRKSLKRKTRHGSLIRGRPNSVNNGLQTALPYRCYNDWSVISSSSPNLSIREDTFTYDDSKFLESPVLQNLDLSLNALLQSISLFSPSNSPNAVSCKGTCLNEKSFTLKPSTLPAEREIKLNHSPVESEKIERVRKEKIYSLKLDSDVNHSNRSSKVNRVDSINTKPLDCGSTILRVEPAETESYQVNEETLGINETNSPDCSSRKEEFNDSCFKTPKNNAPISDSVTWVSGNTFFNNLSPPSAETFNKRESIAMILKSKTGHVQAKVDLYDNKLHKSSSCSAKKYKYPDEKLVRASSQKCYSAGKVMKVSKTKSTCSENRSNSVKGKGRFQMSPLPPPPKFTLTDLPTPPSKVFHPLKELTNVSLDDIKSSISPNKSRKSNTPIKYAESPLLSKGTSTAGPKTKKLKRSSFSGQTPLTLRKKVSRSESSPACRRKVIILHE